MVNIPLTLWDCLLDKERLDLIQHTLLGTALGTIIEWLNNFPSVKKIVNGKVKIRFFQRRSVKHKKHVVYLCYRYKKVITVSGSNLQSTTLYNPICGGNKIGACVSCAGWGPHGHHRPSGSTPSQLSSHVSHLDCHLLLCVSAWDEFFISHSIG